MGFARLNPPYTLPYPSILEHKYLDFSTLTLCSSRRLASCSCRWS